MALAKNKEAAAKFEEAEAGGATQAAVAEKPAETKGSPEAAAAAQTAVTIASAKAGAVVATGGQFGDVFKKYENVIEDLEFGTVARLVGSNGRIVAKKDQKKFGLGGEIRVTLVSFNDEYQVSPGDDTEKGKAAVRYSRDGVKIDGTGESVAAYLEKLRTTDGFPKANVKKYTSLVAILEDAPGADVAAKQFVGEMVQVSLSPTAGTAFKGLRMQVSVKKSRGLLPAEYDESKLVIRADVRQNGQNEYTALAVSDK